MRNYSAFWLGYCAGVLELSAAWEGRDPRTRPLESLPMDEWLQLTERRRVAAVTEYGGSHPAIFDRRAAITARRTNRMKGQTHAYQ